MTKERDRTGRRITIRVSDELHARIAKLAKRDRRSVAGWVKLHIEDVVALDVDDAGTGTGPSTPARTRKR